MESQYRYPARGTGRCKSVDRLPFVSYHLDKQRILLTMLRMLAVMTFNLGFLLVVILGIVVGELVLGRYISGTGWEEGGCHDG